jgi:Meckel syndrome type 1 protein
MIVICTKCQAKFRVADDKIGPRGAKVRCSRCQTVFHVHPEAGGPPPPPAAPPAAPPPLPASRVATDVELENPFVASPVRAPAQAPPVPAPEREMEADPFAAAGFGAPVEPATARDPFAAPPTSADPFGPAADEVDPFASAPAPLAAAQGEEARLAVTDLSDLLGSPTPPEIPQPAGPAPGPSELGLPPIGSPEPGDIGGLALEDRITPPPLPASLARSTLDGVGGVPGPSAGEPFGSEPQAFGAFELGAAEGDLALATEAPAPAPPLVPAPPVPEFAPPAPQAPPPRPAAEARAAPLAEERIRRPRASRLRAVVVNAIALAALVLIAVAMLMVGREGSFEAASFRPSAVLAALGRGGGGVGPFAALDVRSGAYERERGPPLLFVRGKVVSRASAAVPGVKVTVEIVRAEAVVARGEALAGALPTPEELYQAADAAAVAAVAQAAGARAPARIRPGDAVPFLVAIAEYPADLDGARVRVALAEAGGTAP